MVLAFCALVSGCGYYGQAINGELSILNQRRPLEAVIADPGTEPGVRSGLELVLAARHYAQSELGLPESGSFTSYVELDRSYPVWVVYAAPEFSLVPRRWCFPFAGCVPYRGYFHKQDAKAFAAQLVKQGDDVFLTGAPAYSTLGWFDDPVYSSMLRAGNVALVGMIFHELAHQKLYVEGDSAFNESFADTVELIGVKRYFAGRAPDKLQAWLREGGAGRAEDKARAEARASLKVIYASGVPDKQKREEKRAEFAWLVGRYQAIGKRYGIRYSTSWLAGLNNASLAQTRTYDRWVAAFKRLYRCNGKSLPAFYAAASRIGALQLDARHKALSNLEACKISVDNPASGSSAAPQSVAGRRAGEAEGCTQADAADADCARQRAGQNQPAVESGGNVE